MSNRISRVIDWLCNPTTGVIESYRQGNGAEVLVNSFGSTAAITGGTINGTPVGATVRSTLAGTAIALNRGNSTGTPGNVTNNNPVGRAAIAAAGTACVVTNSSVLANAEVFITPLVDDATAQRLHVSNVGAGTFTVTANAAATATTSFSFLVINP